MSNNQMNQSAKEWFVEIKKFIEGEREALKETAALARSKREKRMKKGQKDSV